MDQQDDAKKKPPSGCGVLLVLYNTVFRRQAATPAADTDSIPHYAKDPTKPPPPKRRSDSDEASLLVSAVPSHLPPSKPMRAVGVPPNPNKHRPKLSIGISADLDTMIHDHQRSKGSTNLVRASSGNVMVFSHLGNIRAPGALTPNRTVLEYLPKTAKESDQPPINPTITTYQKQEAEEPVMCRALSRRLDPEELKEMGNEEYKNGRFAEAVALYDRAILMDPDKASYWSNKAAALIGLGHLLEAVGECREAVRIDPSYHRAHHRLATLYLRLGEAEKAVHHYRLSRNDASPNDISRAQAVQTRISRCNEARKLRDWSMMLREAEAAVSAGADSAPQVFASKAEALLMLQRHEDAEATFGAAPKFDIDASTKFFGAPGNAYFLAIRAEIDMAAGRFEDGVSVAHRASRLDPSNKDVSCVARKSRALASARSKGNDLFKASKFEEACLAYGEGLDHEPHNAILLCNRAACRSKVEQWEKAIEDCNAALSLRPSYTKARLRRADCNSKLRRWEASIQDYEILLGEIPGDEVVGKALVEAQAQLKKQQGDDNLVHITTKDQFNDIVMSSGLSVALFFNKPSSEVSKMIQLMELLCKHYSAVKFLKVDMERVPNLLARSESASSIPSFRIYKNGSSVEDIPGSNHDHLESSLKMFTT